MPWERTDGASVMTGKKEGLVGQFLRVNPHIVNTHCSAHRLALCAKQAGKNILAVAEFARSIEQIYYHFKKSPHKVDMMQEIQEVLNDPILRYREVHQIRWLSFNDALQTVVRTLDSLLTYFSTTASKDPKSVGMKKRLGTEMFILMAHGLLDILRPVMKLSLTFQQQDLDIGCIKVEIDACINDLKYLKNPDNPLNKPTYLSMVKVDLKESEPDGKLTFEGHHIGRHTSPHQFSKVFTQYIDAITDNIEQRFTNTELMTSLGVLAMRPITFLQDEEVDDWGDEYMEIMLKHYGNEQTHTYKDPESKQNVTCTSPPKIDSCEARREWKKMKSIIRSQKYPRHSMASLWTLIMQYHACECPNIAVLAALALTHPVHMADCERTFSSQNHIVSPLRNRTTSEHCEEIMRVMI